MSLGEPSFALLATAASPCAAAFSALDLCTVLLPDGLRGDAHREN